MKAASIANPSVLNQPVYEPGKPIEDVARELGLDPKSIIKLASNENPLGPSPMATAAARNAIADGQLYPDGGCFRLRHKLALRLECPPEQVVVGNGSNELLELLGHVFLRPGDEAVMGTPAFIVYKLVTLLFGAKPVEVPMVHHTHDLKAMAKAITPQTKLVFLACPNNPTGTANSASDILAFARDLPPHVVLVYDEAYAEYVDNPPDLRPLIREGRKIVCLRTFSKIYGLAAFRVGYGYTTNEIAGLLQRVRQPFNVNAIGQAAALAALEDESFVHHSVETNRKGLRQLEAGFKALKLEWVPSVGNFILVKVGNGAKAFDLLQRRGVITRPVGSYGLPEWLRITVGTPEQNERLLKDLGAILERL